MLEQIIEAVPERWREVVAILMVPIVWIPGMQRGLVQFLLESPSLWIAAVKYLFLVFPAVLLVVAAWCTQCSLYTLPFRSRRQAFVTTMLVMWWDAVRAVWLYWVGIVRLAVVTAGWFLMFVSLGLKLLMEGAVDLALMPFNLSGRMAKRYVQPGVPWVAFLMLMLWCALEAAVFTYALFPTVAKVLAGLVGADQPLVLAAPVLYLFLLILVMGSFACLQMLVDAIKKRELKWLAQIVAIQLFVMVFEVMFLYRELAQALAPWLAGQLGGAPRLRITLAVATAGWIGVRSMTWLLFGQFGTPSLLAFIARRPAVDLYNQPLPLPAVSAASRRRAEMEELRQELGWLHEKSDQLLEYLALPVLTVMAVALNFCMVLVTSRTAFSLPFKGLKAVMDTGDVLAAMAAQPRKGVST